VETRLVHVCLGLHSRLAFSLSLGHSLLHLIFQVLQGSLMILPTHMLSQLLLSLTSCGLGFL